mmetsp:Transcript_28218/g.71393  ORF Transcript_28218/g.71393 Transcript_28218/m.71393 type:complete len:279 (-) Transcript_28218:310-1146(-)
MALFPHKHVVRRGHMTAQSEKGKGLGPVPSRELLNCDKASSRSRKETVEEALRAARIAASLTSDSSAAPASPSLLLARLRRASSSTSGASGTCLSRKCTMRIRSRPLASGRSTRTTRSKRPGRSNASSRTSGRFVAPMTTTGLLLALPRPTKPSMEVRSWFRVCSASEFPAVLTKSLPRARSASISSIKTMHGASFRARSKSCRTRAAPRPTKSSTNSVAAALRNGTPASTAQARARSVLPEPGGPTIKTPRGTRAPSAAYGSGFRNIFTTSATSCLA